MNDLESVLKSLDEAKTAICSALDEVQKLFEKRAVKSDPNEHLGYLVDIQQPDFIVPVHGVDVGPSGIYSGFEQEVMPTKREALEAYLRTYEIFKIKQHINNVPYARRENYDDYGCNFIHSYTLEIHQKPSKETILYPLYYDSACRIVDDIKNGELSIIPDNIDALREAADGS